MARYIDADALLEKLQVDFDKQGRKSDYMALRGEIELSVKYNHGQYCYLNAMEQVKDIPTADVVPKSEYDAVVSAVDNSTKEFLKLHDKYQEAKREIDNLKVLLEMKDVSYAGLKELYDIDTTALIEAREKTEVEVAREIFEDLDNLAQFIQVPSEFKDGCLMITNSPYLCIKPSDYAELKKIYTEEK